MIQTKENLANWESVEMGICRIGILSNWEFFVMGISNWEFVELGITNWELRIGNLSNWEFTILNNLTIFIYLILTAKKLRLIFAKKSYNELQKKILIVILSLKD